MKITKSADEYFEELAELGLLEEIFKLISFRRSLTLVNKLFYNTVCKIDSEADIYKAKIMQEDIQLENTLKIPLVYDSMINTKRILTELYLDRVYFIEMRGSDAYKENLQNTLIYFMQFLRLKMTNLKKLTFESCILTESQLMNILSSLNGRQLEEFNIVNSVIVHESTKKFQGILLFPNLQTLNLSSTYGCIDRIQSIIDDNVMFSFLKSINEYSKELKNLTVRDIFAQNINFTKFKLTTLCIKRITPSCLRISDVISQQLFLTSVDLLDCYIMEDVLNMILQLEKIKILRINLDGISIKGFNSISQKKSLQELGLKCSNSCSWIVSAFAMTKLDFLNKLYLDIMRLSVDFFALCRMLNKKIPNIHLLASQFFVLDCVFSSTHISQLGTLTVDIDIQQHINKPLINKFYCMNGTLLEFTLINRNPHVVNYDCALGCILEQNPFLKKIRIEGLVITKQIFDAVIRNHYYLRELYLIGPKNVPCTFVFDKKYATLIQKYGGSLKTMVISCLKSKLKSSKQFPFIIRREDLKIFRSGW